MHRYQREELVCVSLEVWTRKWEERKREREREARKNLNRFWGCVDGRGGGRSSEGGGDNGNRGSINPSILAEVEKGDVVTASDASTSE